MKHFILILAAIAFSTGLSLAQTQDSTSTVLQENLPETQMTKKEIRKAAMPEQRNEITIGYGWGTFIDATFIFANGLVTAFSAGHIRTDNYQALGSVNAEYYRVLNKTFSVGGSFSWTGGSADIINKEDVKTGKSHYSAFVIMPSVKAFWFRKKHVAMYSKLALGSPCLTDLTTRNQKGTIRRSLPVRQALSAYRQAANTYAAFLKPAEACKVS